MGVYKRVTLFSISVLAGIACAACSADDDSGSENNSSDPDVKDGDTDTAQETEDDTEKDSDTINGVEVVIGTKDAKGCDLVSVTNVEISPEINTVGIIEWTSEEDVSSAHIEFGPLDGEYRWKAPVDLDEPDYRTLLLGMKTDSIYKYRIVAMIDGEECVGGARGIKTGGLPTELPYFTQEGESSGGFIVSTSFVNSFSGDGGWSGAFILDEDGDLVWWYEPDYRYHDWVRARISRDGKYMLIANGNYPDFKSGRIIKVSLDGTSEEEIAVPNRHHDLLELPFDGILAYMEYETSGTGICDQIVERTPDGETTVVFKVRDHFSHRETTTDWCHSNALNYVESEDAYYVSVLNQNMIIKFNRTTGELEWTMGGLDTDFPGIWWDKQHQHHLLEDSILIFNNYGGATDEVTPEEIDDGTDMNEFIISTAHIVEYSFDEDDKTASLVWDYHDGRLGSMAMGDTKRLPNGNTQIVYSVSGVIQEVDSDMEKVYEIVKDGIFGYASRRGSLYAAPPEYDYYPKR